MQNLNEIIEQIANIKGISKKDVISSLENAVLVASKKKFGYNKEIDVRFNEEENEIEIFEFRTIVEKKQKECEISIKDAKELDPDCEVGDEIGIKIENSELGRVSAHLAKDILNLRITSEERRKVFSKFSHRKGELATGIVSRIEIDNLVVDLGNVEGAIPKRFQNLKEKYKIGDKINAYILDVNDRMNSYQIILSRTAPELISALFINECEELRDNTIKIENVVREAGIRTKIAVSCINRNIDPVSTLIGYAGVRIKEIKREISNERIDVVRYDEDPAKFACNALFPISVERVLVDTNNKKMDITVPDDQYSIAIGKNGSNIKLISQLVKWKVMIISSSKDKEEREKSFNELKSLGVLNEMKINTLFNFGIRSKKDIENADLNFLTQIPTIGENLGKKIKEIVLHAENSFENS